MESDSVNQSSRLDLDGPVQGPVSDPQMVPSQIRMAPSSLIQSSDLSLNGGYSNPPADPRKQAQGVSGVSFKVGPVITQESSSFETPKSGPILFSRALKKKPSLPKSFKPSNYFYNKSRGPERVSKVVSSKHPELELNSSKSILHKNKSLQKQRKVRLELSSKHQGNSQEMYNFNFKKQVLPSKESLVVSSQIKL